MNLAQKLRQIASWWVLGLSLGLDSSSLRALDCDVDGLEDDEAIAQELRSDCNGNAIPDICEFAPVSFGPLGDSLPLETSPDVVVVADVTGDGRDDLVIGAGRRFDTPARITIIPSLGGTAFDSPRVIDPGLDLNSVTASDLDGDGDLDLATVDNIGVVRGLTNDGSGVFAVPWEIPLPAYSEGVTAADLDGDGAPDLITIQPSADSITWLLQQSDGAFLPSASVPVGEGPVNLAISDFDQDGRPDVAVTAAAAQKVNLLLAPLAGSSEPVELISGDRMRALAVTDFDSDGSPEVVTAGLDGVRIWSNQGDGSFGTPVKLLGPSAFLSLGDFDGDQATDVVVGNFTGSKLTVLRNRGGSLLSQRSFSFDFVDIASGDLDGDGDLDLCALPRSPSQATVLWNGEFALDFNEAQERPFDRPHFVDTGDFNGDGSVDAITVNAGDLTYSLLFGGGDGSFERAIVRPTERAGLLAVGAADFDKDGNDDVVFHTRALLVFLPNLDGSGDFPTWIDYPTHGTGRFLLVEDFDGDGHQDVAALDFFANVVSVHFNDGSGNFSARKDLAVGAFPWEVATADLDGDGTLDLVTANGNSSDVSILLQRGRREFEAAGTIPVDGFPHGVVTLDADRDGDMDVVTANDRSTDVAVFLNDGGAKFAPSGRVAIGRRPYAILATDLDGDGLRDLAVTSERSATVSVLRGRGDGLFATAQHFKVGIGPRFTTGSDLDSDGDTDLLVACRGIRRLTVLTNNTSTGEERADSLPKICTELDFFDLSVGGRRASVRRLTRFLLPAREATVLPATVFLNAARFTNAHEFLTTVFPEDFPNVSESAYDALVGHRATRSYFTGEIRSLERAVGIAYGVDIQTAKDAPEEIPTPQEVSAVIERLAETFLLESLLYAPTDMAVQEAAELWGPQAFEVVPLPTEQPTEAPRATPTFELFVPEGTSVCGVFGVGGANRGPAEELALKSTVRLRTGVIPLPTTDDRFTAELFEEVLFGPQGVPAEPMGPGEFVVGRIPGAIDLTTYRFTYAQPFRLADGRILNLTLVSPLQYRGRGEDPIERRQPLPPVVFTALKGREALQAELDGQVLVRYGSCDYSELTSWTTEWDLADGIHLSLRERFDEAEIEFDTAPAALVYAELRDGGQSEEVVDYFQLIYSALRHNTEVTYWVVLDPPRRLAGKDSPVAVLELRAPEKDSRPVAEVVFRSAAFEVIEQVPVVTYSRMETVLFRRGDVDGTGTVTIADAVRLLDDLFRPTEPMTCTAAGDVNDDSRLNLLDPIAIVGLLFGRREIPPPAVACGVDPTPDRLSCEMALGCE